MVERFGDRRRHCCRIRGRRAAVEEGILPGGGIALLRALKSLEGLKAAGGTVDNIDMWGRRRLAYDIQKQSEGIYAVLEVTAEPDVVKELDRQYTLNEQIMRTKVLRPDLHK